MGGIPTDLQNDYADSADAGSELPTVYTKRMDHFTPRKCYASDVSAIVL